MPIISSLGALTTRYATMGRIRKYILTATGSTNYIPYSIKVDNVGNYIVAGVPSGSIYNNAPQVAVIKFDNDGNKLWDYLYNVTTGVTMTVDPFPVSIDVDSSDNIYLSGPTSGNASTTGIGTLFMKLNNLGTVQWSGKLYRGSSSDVVVARGNKVDSSGNMYYTGYTTSSGDTSYFLCKVDSSGTNQWAQTLDTNSTTNVFGYGVDCDSSGNVYTIGYSQASSSVTRYALLVKYNSSGTIQWQRHLGSSSFTSSQYLIGNKVSVYGTDVYYVGYEYDNGSYIGVIAKYNTSGTLQWQRNLTGANIRLNDLKVDNTGIFITGYVGTLSTTLLALKLDSSGSLLWQKTLTSSSGSNNGLSIDLDTSGSMVIADSAASSVSGVIRYAKLPSDGTIPGTGTTTIDTVTYTYSASSYTLSTSTYTSSTSGWGSVSITFSVLSQSLNVSSTGLTVDIGAF